jgi:hypothetical protein
MQTNYGSLKFVEWVDDATDRKARYKLTSEQITLPRIQYKGIDYHPHMNKEALKDSNLSMRHIKIHQLPPAAEIVSYVCYDTFAGDNNVWGARRPYVFNPAYTSRTHYVLENPSHWAVSLTREVRDKIQTTPPIDTLMFEVILINWKHNWDRFNIFEIDFLVPEEFRENNHILEISDRVYLPETPIGNELSFWVTVDQW